MKFFIIILLTLLSLPGNTQRYSEIVTNNEISNFLTWFVRNDSAQEIKYVNKDITELDEECFRYMDTMRLPYLPANIFINAYRLDTIFTKADADFFIKQIRFQKANAWHLRLGNVKLIKYVSSDEVRWNREAFYYFSLPLFSVDMQYVIIDKSCYCGLDCGYGNYFLYRRQSAKSWKKVNAINGWVE